jgi:hypothetical protein
LHKVETVALEFESDYSCVRAGTGGPCRGRNRQQMHKAQAQYEGYSEKRNSNTPPGLKDPRVFQVFVSFLLGKNCVRKAT